MVEIKPCIRIYFCELKHKKNVSDEQREINMIDMSGSKKTRKKIHHFDTMMTAWWSELIFRVFSLSHKSTWLIRAVCAVLRGWNTKKKKETYCIYLTYKSSGDVDENAELSSEKNINCYIFLFRNFQLTT